MGLLDAYIRQRERMPYVSEYGYFVANPEVAGMAAQDGNVVLNPFSSGVNQDAVYRNELSRLYMRENPVSLPLTTEQSQFLNGNSYANASNEDRTATIIARLLSGDKSAGQPTFQQDSYARKLTGILDYF